MKNDAATTAKGGVIARTMYPSIKRASEIIRVLALPSLLDNELMKKAAATNPSALQTKMIETVPYAIRYCLKQLVNIQQWRGPVFLTFRYWQSMHQGRNHSFRSRRTLNTRRELGICFCRAAKPSASVLLLDDVHYLSQNNLRSERFESRFEVQRVVESWAAVPFQSRSCP